MDEVVSDQTTLPSLATAKPSNLKYPKSVAVLKTASNSDWFVGDTLLGELGPPSLSGAHDGSKKIFEEIVAEATAVDGHCPLSALHSLGDGQSPLTFRPNAAVQNTHGQFMTRQDPLISSKRLSHP